MEYFWWYGWAPPSHLPPLVTPKTSNYFMKPQPPKPSNLNNAYKNAIMLGGQFKVRGYFSSVMIMWNGIA